MFTPTGGRQRVSRRVERAIPTFRETGKNVPNPPRRQRAGDDDALRLKIRINGDETQENLALRNAAGDQ
ncbi:hypothetical protein LJR255_003456 [Pararhizobium sp. LjRoot255]|uniref:hypothetical protein n=1 Tax=Pararhizobium sp. LjRoot255 TaxID=3342298 RepID=UPI003ECE628E